jgi:Tfp pilus assembly protein FimT
MRRDGFRLVMRQDGFSLVELMTVIGIMIILTSLATMNWSSMQKKSFTVKQAKTLYADLNGVRLDALYTKRPRSVVLTHTQFRIYSSTVTTVTPASTTAFGYPVKWNNTDTSLTITFDAAGLSTATADVPLCVDPDNNMAVTAATVDSVVVATARMKLGKREGTNCAVSGITQK